MLLLLLLLLIGANAHNWFMDRLEQAGVAAMGFDTGDTCGFTRVNALACLKRHVDANHDGIIDAAEFERAKRLYMPARARAAMWVARQFGYDVTLAQVMKDCDADKDGKFTQKDWLASAKTCLPTAADLCKLKTACDLAEQVDKKK